MIARRLLRPVCAGLLSLALLVPAASAFGIGLQPTTVEMDVQPGERKRQVITLANVHTEKTISLTLGLADWSLDETGQLELSPPGEMETSAASWVRFSPAFVTLRPGQSQQIIVDMAAPARINRSGDFRFALLASTVLPEERGGQSGVWKKYQIASLFYLTAGEARSAPAITEAALVETAEGETSVELRLENSGNAHARLEGAIDLRGPGGARLSLPIANLVVLDGGSRIYRVPLAEAFPAATTIEVSVKNIFTPHLRAGEEMLPVFRASAERRREQAGGSDGAAP